MKTTGMLDRMVRDPGQTVWKGLANRDVSSGVRQGINCIDSR